MSTHLPVSGRFAWWATAWLHGHVVTDLVVDAVLGDDVTHAVAGLHDLGLGGPTGTDTLVGGLARLRVEGARSVGAAFPVEGDPVGLGGPPELNAAALDAGEAVITDVGVGLVPVAVGPATTWVAYAARRPQLPDVGEADRALRRELVEAASALAALDVARWRPEVADLLMNLRHRAPLTAPPGVPQRCVELAERATQALEIVDAALVDDGAAISAHEADARRTALVGLGRAARHGLVAACSPEAWPPA